jgi:hypothetical protein
VGHGDPEGVDRLARERSPALVGDGHGDHHRQRDAGLVEDVAHGRDRSFGVERVEDRLDQQHVHTALDQGPRLLDVGRVQLVEAEAAEGRVLDVGRQRQRLVGGSDGAGHEARLVGRLRGPLPRRLDGEPGRAPVQLDHHVFEGVVGLGDPVAAEGVGLDDVGSRGEIGVVDLTDHVGTGQHQHLVVALEVAGVVREALAAEVGLPEARRLEHGAHGPIEHEDPLCEQLLDPVAAARVGIGVRHGVGSAVPIAASGLEVREFR